MHKTLIIDIETTGLVPHRIVPGKRPGTTKKESLDYKTDFLEFPHIVSIGWKIDDLEAEIFILNQEGREIPQEASDIHKITTEVTEKSEHLFHEVIIGFIKGDCSDCEIVVGHGIYFDTSIIKANVLREVHAGRLSQSDFDAIENILHKTKRIDTMRSSAKMMRKWPTLSELHQKIFHIGFDAHNLKEDIEATHRCYGWLLEKGIVPTWEELQEKAEEAHEKTLDT